MRANRRDGREDATDRSWFRRPCWRPADPSGIAIPPARLCSPTLTTPAAARYGRLSSPVPLLYGAASPRVSSPKTAEVNRGRARRPTSMITSPTTAGPGCSLNRLSLDTRFRVMTPARRAQTMTVSRGVKDKPQSQTREVAFGRTPITLWRRELQGSQRSSPPEDCAHRLAPRVARQARLTPTRQSLNTQGVSDDDRPRREGLPAARRSGAGGGRSGSGPSLPLELNSRPCHRK
jgi:hypothetical protein